MKKPPIISQSVKRLYNQASICIGTLLGWPLAGLYMLSKNSKNIGDKEWFKRFFRNWIIIAAFLIWLSLVLNMPRAYYLIVAIGILACYLYYRKFQIETIKKELKDGRKLYSVRNIIGVILIARVITFIYCLFFLLVYRWLK